MAAFTLHIVTPESTIFSGSVKSLQAPGTQGSFGVLARHAPMIAAMKIGMLGFVEEGASHSRTLACSGGFVEVQGDSVTVLAEAAEFGEAIDRGRAEAASQRARERLSQGQGVDSARAEAALAKALNRLRIAIRD
jgi:F-type H+-transporting ATPase subunit epsilon